MIIDKVKEYPFVKLTKDKGTNEISFYALTVFKDVKAEARSSSFERKSGSIDDPHILTISVNVQPLPTFKLEIEKPQLTIHHSKLGTFEQDEIIEIWLEKYNIDGNPTMIASTQAQTDPASSKEKKGTVTTGDADDDM